MKNLLLACLLLTLIACNFDVTPDVKDQTYITRTVEVFDGTLDTASVQYEAGPGYFTCNPDTFTVEYSDTGVAYTGITTCISKIYTRTDIKNAPTPTPLISN